MLGSAPIARAAAQALAAHAKVIPLVVDPVMVATSGARLADTATIDVLKAEFFPRAAVITPNLPEAEVLCGFPLASPEEIVHAGEALLALGPQSVLVKGGHGASDTLVDTLFVRGAPPREFRSTRITTTSTHGTGCTLSTAIACGLGQGLALPDAVARAHAFVQNAIKSAPGFGAGHGPLNHLRSQ
jgi:hydroxymethylpyrimidine/phosphomethylpyrimidine kinase